MNNSRIKDEKNVVLNISDLGGYKDRVNLSPRVHPMLWEAYIL